MPPKRKRPSPSTTPTSNATAAADTTTSTTSPSLTATALDPSDAPPFLNTTFTTHRVSPLHIGTAQTLTQERLTVLSQRLRDLLVGDVVRGVELGLSEPRTSEDGVMRRAGALEAVSLGWVRLEDLLGRYVGGEEAAAALDSSLESVESALAGPGKRRALQMGLQYEHGEYTALLLPALGSVYSLEGGGEEEEEEAAGSGYGVTDDDPEFLQLPLLMLRMPAPLKAVICGFISRTFDCRISSLRLGTRSLVGALERWLRESKAPGHGVMAKDAMVTLGFYTPSALREPQKKPTSHDHDQHDDNTRTSGTSLGIKAIDVTIPLADLQRFIKAGRACEATRTTGPDHHDPYSPGKRRRLGGDKDEEGWAWRFHDATRAQPFTEALAAYLRHHLALKLFHPAVRVTRIACGGFVLSEGRVKLFGVPPVGGEEGDGTGRNGLSDGMQRAAWAVFGGLVERSRVGPLVRTLGR